MTSTTIHNQNTNQLPTFIWVDVSKSMLHIFNPKSKSYFQIKNNINDIKKFFSQFLHSNYIIVYEPTWIYSKKLSFVLNQLWITHLQIHPNKIKNLASSLWIKNKTDKLDATSISELSSIMYLSEMHSWKKIFTMPNSNITDKISHLLSQIDFYKSQIKSIKQNLEILNNSPYSDQNLIDFNHSLIHQLQQKIKSLQNQIESLLEQSKNTQWKVNIMSSIPWVGKLTAIILVFFFKKLEEKWFKKEDFKKMLAYSWLIPIQHSSWTKSYSHLLKKWDIKISNALYMSWMFRFKASKYDHLKNSNLGAFALSMINKFSSNSNKRWKSIACAISKKILTIARAMYRNNSYYSPNYNYSHVKS